MAEVELPNPEELHEHADKTFSRRVALVTAVYAVVLAIASLGGNNAMKEMLLAQQKSSDQWAFYQAKVIREHLYRAQKLRLETELADRRRSGAPSARSSRRCSGSSPRKRSATTPRRRTSRRTPRSSRPSATSTRPSDPYFDYRRGAAPDRHRDASVSILARSGLIFSLQPRPGRGGRRPHRSTASSCCSTSPASTAATESPEAGRPPSGPPAEEQGHAGEARARSWHGSSGGSRRASAGAGRR